MFDEQPQPEEQSIALDAHVAKLRKLVEATDNIKFWTQQRAQVQEELAKIMGDATIGTVNGRQAVTYRTEERFRGADFKKVYPDTYRSFVHDVTTQRFDVELLKASRPDLYQEFQVRSMKPTFEE